MAEQRVVKTDAAKGGFSIQDLILVSVLLAAGAVLKLTLGSVLTFAGMKPNFIIAMYCTAVLLTRCRPLQALVIGLIAGLVCQIPMLNATPWLNILSEALGALAMGLLILIPMKAGKLNLGPFVSTFLATAVSGYSFVIQLVVFVQHKGWEGVVPALATYAVMVLGTATFNAVVVTALEFPLRKVLKR